MHCKAHQSVHQRSQAFTQSDKDSRFALLIYWSSGVALYLAAAYSQMVLKDVKSIFCQLFVTQVLTSSDTFMLYGPVVSDGYGVSYNPQPGRVVFCISSRRSCLDTDSHLFSAALTASLADMKNLCIAADTSLFADDKMAPVIATSGWSRSVRRVLILASGPVYPSWPVGSVYHSLLSIFVYWATLDRRVCIASLESRSGIRKKCQAKRSDVLGTLACRVVALHDSG